MIKMKENNLRNSFDDIFLSKVPDKLDSVDIEELIDNKKSKVPVKSTDYGQRRNSMHSKAQKTIDSLLRFYLKEEIISEDEYIKQRALQEKATLSDLMNQIENVNGVITTMMERIDTGDVSYKMFEVLSEVEKTFIELLKMKSMHLIQVEESVKKLINDRRMYNNTLSSGEQSINSGVSMRGTKNLMKQIRDAVENKDFTAEEADIE